MGWVGIKQKLTKSEDIICDKCDGTGKLKTKPPWIDIVLLGIAAILMGILVLVFYLQYYFLVNA